MEGRKGRREGGREEEREGERRGERERPIVTERKEGRGESKEEEKK